MAVRIQSAILIAVLAAVVVVFFGDILLGDRVLVTSNTYRWRPWADYAAPDALDDKTYRTDAARTYLPRRVYAKSSIASGDFPLWNPYILGGSPFFADPQTAVLYPAGLLLLPADPAKAMGYDVALHFFLASLGMFLFLGAIDATGPGRMLGALAYGFSSFFFLRMGHPTFVAAAAWLPYLFFAYERSKRPVRARGLLLALFLCLGYLAGMPQVFLFGVAALLFYAAVDGIEALIRGDRRGAWRNCRVICLAAAIALLTVCVQLVPFIEYVRNSRGLGFGFEAMSRDHLWRPVFLLRTLVPDIFGNPVDGTSWIGLLKGQVHPYNSGFMVYCGVGGLALALASLVFLKKSSHIRALFGLLVLSVGAGTSVVVLRLLYAVFPPAAYSQIDRVSILACFALAALAGKGISLARDAEDARARRNFIAVPAVLAVIVACGSLVFRLRGVALVAGLAREAAGLAGETWFAKSAFRLVEWLEQGGTAWFEYEMRHIGYGLVFACLSAILIWLYVRYRHRPRLSSAAVGLLTLTLALDLGLAARRYYVTQPADCLAETEGIRMLSESVGGEGRWRIGGMGSPEEVLPPNTPQLYGIPVFGGLNALYPSGYARRLGLASALVQSTFRASPVVSAVGDLMCVRYLVTDRPRPELTASPLIAAMAGSRVLFGGLGIVDMGGDRRLSFLQTPGDACSLYVHVPECGWLDFALGLTGSANSNRDGPLNAEIVLRGRGVEEIVAGSGPLVEAGRAWVGFRLDVSSLAGRSAAVVLRVTGGAHHSGLGVAWSGFDFVRGDCRITEMEGGYEVDAGGPDGTLALRLEGPAGEWPVGIVRAGTGGGPVTRFIRFSRPGGSALMLLEAGAFGEKTLIRTGKDIELVEARLLHTESGVPVGLRPFYDGDMFIYENQAAMPKGICVEQSLFGGLGPAGEHPGRLEAGRVIGALASHRVGHASVRLYEAGRVAVDVSAEQACVLLFQDTWYPGWRAAVDGVETPVLRTDLGIRAVLVGRGEHEVIMEYRPGSLKLGLGLSLLGILLGVIYGAKAKRH